MQLLINNNNNIPDKSTECHWHPSSCFSLRLYCIVLGLFWKNMSFRKMYVNVMYVNDYSKALCFPLATE